MSICRRDDKSFLKKIKFTHELMLLSILIVVCVILSCLSKYFFTVTNLLGITKTLSEVGLIALPMTLIIITGGIDLSVSAIMGMCAVIFGATFTSTGSIELSIIICIGVGTIAGLINGVLIAKSNIPPMVVTLATMYVYEGLALGISLGKPYRGYPEWFFTIGTGKICGIPVQFIILIIFTIIFYIFLNYTSNGRSLYAIGHNERAARFSGIKIDKLKISIYAICGFICSLATIMFVSRISSAKADAGVGYNFNSITAVFLGGASFTGGAGSILGTFLGIILIGIIKNGICLLLLPSELKSIAIGALLIGSVLYNNAVDKRKMKKKIKGGVKNTTLK